MCMVTVCVCMDIDCMWGVGTAKVDRATRPFLGLSDMRQGLFLNSTGRQGLFLNLTGRRGLFLYSTGRQELFLNSTGQH